MLMFMVKTVGDCGSFLLGEVKRWFYCMVFSVCACTGVSGGFMIAAKTFKVSSTNGT